ncbi:uncharacterized protein LOC134800445 [Cydia splendana]|uniref:uncharacterized protein LOC134800445 n=1 Tax=Cydia splendana TaxID=1100963 RepID=UPI0021348A23
MGRNEGKIEWLRAVFEAKDILFGPFSDTLTKTDKVLAWKSMHALAQSLALVPNNKEYTYTRDTFWQNLRKNAVKKRDNSRATGSGTTKFTNIDEMVYSIIGKESPVLVGLPVAESGEVVTERHSNPLNSIGIDGNRLTSTNNIAHGEPSNASALAKKTSTNRTAAPQHKIQKKRMQDLKYKKHFLMVQLLEKENYLKELKIKKIEKELNIDSNERAKQANSSNNSKQMNEDASSSDEEQYEVDYLEEMEDSE